MKVAYFIISTTGPHHDRDYMDEFSGILYDHSLGRVIDKFHYQSVADMHVVNDMPVPAYRAADLLQSWLSGNHFYITINIDKIKHFLRAFLFYQYLNPFDHERSGRQNKFLDGMMLLRASHHIGECPIELPVSPLGEVRYEVDRLRDMNFPGNDIPHFLAGVVSGLLDTGGRAFSLIKSQDEKRRLLTGQRPIVHLGLIDKEVEVTPRVLMPFASSDRNRNRFYVFEPTDAIRTPQQAIKAHLDYRDRGEKSMTSDMYGRGIEYIDANKSDLIVSLSDLSSRYRLDYLSYQSPRLRKQGISELMRLLDSIDTIESVGYKNKFPSLYQANFTRHHVSVWKEAREMLIKGDYKGAKSILRMKERDGIEQSRVIRFLRDNGITLSSDLIESREVALL